MIQHRTVALGMAVAMVLTALVTLADTTYRVRKNDTLTSIAADHGLSVSRLAEYNDLPRDAKVYTGQRLRIPTPAASSSQTTLNRAVQKAIARAPVQRGRWKYIVIHHSGTEVGTMAGMDAYHRERRHMENGLAYHFVIGNGQGMADGEIGVARRWTQQLDGGHLASEALNKVSLGICLVGNFDQVTPTAKQIRSLEALVRALLTRCELSTRAVRTHQGINPVYTRCPGRYFPKLSFVE